MSTDPRAQLAELRHLPIAQLKQRWRGLTAHKPRAPSGRFHGRSCLTAHVESVPRNPYPLSQHFAVLLLESYVIGVQIVDQVDQGALKTDQACAVRGQVA